MKTNPSTDSTADSPARTGTFSKPKAIAQRLGVCPTTIRRWGQRGFIHPHKVNARVVLFSDAEVDEFVRSARVA